MILGGSGQPGSNDFQRHARTAGRVLRAGLRAGDRDNRRRRSRGRSRYSARHGRYASRYEREYDRRYRNRSGYTRGASTGSASCLGFVLGTLLILGALALWVAPIVTDFNPLAAGQDFGDSLRDMGMKRPERLPLFMLGLGIAIIVVGYVFAIISTLLTALLTRISRAVSGRSPRSAVRNEVRQRRRTDDLRESTYARGTSRDDRSPDDFLRGTADSSTRRFPE